MSDNQEREEAHTGNISNNNGMVTRQEQRTYLHGRNPFLKEDYPERAEEIADWALRQNIQDYPDKFFGSFV